MRVDLWAGILTRDLPNPMPMSVAVRYKKYMVAEVSHTDVAGSK
jgi:hypothetical protein